jgi:hypothetical protein
VRPRALIAPLFTRLTSLYTRVGAQLMSNLAELLIRTSPTPEKLHQAEEWAKQASAVIQRTTRATSSLPTTCEHALSAVLFNLGALREVGIPSYTHEHF